MGSNPIGGTNDPQGELLALRAEHHLRYKRDSNGAGATAPSRGRGNFQQKIIRDRIPLGALMIRKESLELFELNIMIVSGNV